MLAALLSVAVAASAGSTSYDLVDGHPPSWYDKQVVSIDAPAAGSNANCVDRLTKAGIKIRLLSGVKGVETPVEVVDTSLGLVRYKPGPKSKRRFILDCHTVEVLASLGRRLRKAGIATIYWSSAWRYTYRKGTKKLSAHARGLALDVVAIDGKFGYATVKGHYERGVGGCGEDNKAKQGKHLRRFACAITHDRAFGTLYTPDTDAMHADHFHMENPDPAIEYKPVRPRKARWFMYLLAFIAVLLFSAAGYWWMNSDSTEVEQ